MLFFDALSGCFMDQREIEELTLCWTAAQRVVAAFLRTFVRDPHENEDLLQRVAIVVVRRFSEYDRSRSFAAWAIGIAKREVLAHRRRSSADPHIFDDALIQQVARTYQSSLAANGSELRDALERCLEKLKGHARQAVELHYAQGLKSCEVAKEVGMGHGAVRMLLSRTRQALHQCIEHRLGRRLLGT